MVVCLELTCDLLSLPGAERDGLVVLPAPRDVGGRVSARLARQAHVRPLAHHHVAAAALVQDVRGNWGTDTKRGLSTDGIYYKYHSL